MTRIHLVWLAALGVGLLGFAEHASPTAQAPTVSARPPWTASLSDIRRVARMIPGPRPRRINLATFAESHRTKNLAVQGAPAEPSVQARTAFQIVYPDGHVMVDSGMDEQVHRAFGRGADEPYDQTAADAVARAVRGAKLVVLTHEHGDHVAGAIRSPFADEIAPKTILTRTQAQALVLRPQLPEIALTPELAARYVVVDYDNYLPLAPGLVVIKAAGHTPGSQMVFVTLASSAEYLLIGDVAWHMDGVREVKGKDAPWVVEDEAALMSQLEWLNTLSRDENAPIVVVSHDAEQHRQLIARGALGSQLEP